MRGPALAARSCCSCCLQKNKVLVIFGPSNYLFWPCPPSTLLLHMLPVHTRKGIVLFNSFPFHFPSTIQMAHWQHAPAVPASCNAQLKVRHPILKSINCRFRWCAISASPCHFSCLHARQGQGTKIAGEWFRRRPAACNAHKQCASY